MKNKKCPNRYACFGYDEGTCDTCDIGILINKLSKRIKRLKKKLEKAEQLPDVVEVVRCKDCIYSEKPILDECPKGVLHCRKLYTVAHEKHYCSYGERRED